MTGVAIVGIALRLPDAGDTAEFRANLLAGRDSVGDLSADRIRATCLDPATDYLPMGYLDGIDLFDPGFFGMSRREAELVDPQHRLALMLACEAIQDAGYPVSQFHDSATAAVFSLPDPDYYGTIEEKGTLSTLGNVPFGLPARIAHTFGLLGPCYGVDSGCNSTLVAVRQACRELRDGAADYALVGGVSVKVAPVAREIAAGFTELVSPDGRCRAFDRAADGAAGGEGGVVMLLTDLDRAIAERAPIRAVIRGTAVRHNGRQSATISSPSAIAQAAVIREAWNAAGLDPESAGYVEAHGSGTRLGDAVEIEGLGTVFSGRAEPVPIGSVKTNIGHLDHVAGIAGLLKAVLSVEHGELYPSLHFKQPAEGVDLDAARVAVVTSPGIWPSGPRHAGVSSFSLGGTNAHCVIDQAPPLPHTPVHPGQHLVGVSSRTPETLAGLCTRLASALQNEQYALTDVAFTLNQGRDHDRCRIAVLAGDVDELATELAKRATAPPEPVTAPRVVVLLSPDSEVPKRDCPLPDLVPLTGSPAEVAAWQIAAYAELERAGVRPDGVLSSGLSRYTARYLLGTLSNKDNEELADQPVDHRRLETAAAGYLGDGPVTFVELGTRGALGDHLDTYLCDQPDATVIRAEDVPGLLGVLYEQGVDLDWSALGTGDAPRRLSLPAMPFEQVRCWAGSERGTQATEDSQSTVDWMRANVADLLHADTVTADTNFFDNGGNSIIAVQLIDRLADEFGVRPKILDIYLYPVVAGFAAHVDSLRGAGGRQGGSFPPVEPGAGLVVSFGQERMWFHHQLDPVTTLYNMPTGGRVLGPLDIEALRLAWEDMAARHEVLRSNFVDVDGRPALVIRPALGDFFRLVDVSDADDPASAARQLVHAEANRKFDLAHDPLLRVLVVRLADEDHVMLLTTHHSVNDGGAPAILEREFDAFYTARRDGTVHTLPPLPVQYRDFAHWQRDLLAGSALRHELDYWTEHLRDAPVLRLPTDFPRPSRKNFSGDVFEFDIPAGLVRELRDMAGRESASLFMVLLAAFYRLLARYSGQDDIVIGTPTTGRNRPELWPLLGYFNGTVALRTDLSGQPGTAELVRRVRTVVLDALEHQEIPFDRVVDAMAGDRDLSRTPLFDVAFIHQELPVIKPVGGTRFTPAEDQREAMDQFVGLPPGTAKYDLTLITLDREGVAEITASFEYSTELFTVDTIADMTDAYLEILHAAIEECA
jgi:3-oxoacyl-(acyl-carrier-protein) synthase/acyl carrier protein